jgi:hypothetical protein
VIKIIISSDETGMDTQPIAVLLGLCVNFCRMQETYPVFKKYADGINKEFSEILVSRQKMQGLLNMMTEAIKGEGNKV